jgi:type VI secretion system FHA domain protein
MSISLYALPNAADALFSGRVSITKTRFSIGRANDNDWIINDAKRMVSKYHCTVERTADGYRLIDRSTNGVTVNGKPVDRNFGHTLRNGDEIEVAQYRFRVELAGTGAPAPDLDEAQGPKITAILHDVASGGVSATGRLPGQHDDILPASNRTANSAQKPRLGAEIGWDGPPPKDHEVVRPRDILAPRDREFVNRTEQTPTDRLRIELPKPKQIIPDNWLDEAADTGSAQGDAAPATTEPWTAQIIPVENIDLGDRGAGPDLPPLVEQAVPEPFDYGREQLPPMPSAGFQYARDRSAELLQAFCDGAGVDARDIESAELTRFFRNAGRLLAISAVELQSLQMTRNKVSALLEMAEGEAAHTPWIFSLSGEDRARVTEAVALYMRDAEPRDLEMMRSDFAEIGTSLERIANGVIAFVEKLQQALSVQQLDKHVPATARALPALRKAALWDSLLQHSGIFQEKKGKGGTPDLLSLLASALGSRAR